MAVRRARACALLLATVLLGLASPAFPCGPFFPQAVFTFTRHPDLPLENFLRGQLGIVLPTYSRSYLYLSYRYLAGKPFSPEQLAALEGVWIRRRPSDVSGALQKAPKPPNWIKLWVEARKKIPGLDTSAPTPGVHNPLGAYRSERIGTTYIGYYNWSFGCISHRSPDAGGKSWPIWSGQRRSQQLGAGARPGLRQLFRWRKRVREAAISATQCLCRGLSADSSRPCLPDGGSPFLCRQF